MTFTHIELLYYFLPGLLLVLLIRWSRQKHFVAHSRLSQMQEHFTHLGRWVYLPIFLQWAALAALILAALNPILTFAEQQITIRGLDIILVVDLSASMQQALPVNAAEAKILAQSDAFFARRDKNPSRMDAVKLAVKNFIRHRQNDRLGLVVFSSNAYVVSPMTMDYDYLTQYVDMMDHRTLVGEGLTAIGEGIYTAVKLMFKQNENRKGKAGDRLFIVLTDGENNYGRSPVEAVHFCKEKGIKVYMVGVDVPVTQLTENLIYAIESAGGNYYDVRNQEQLDHAYWEIGALEKGDFAVKEYDRSVPLYHQAVLAAFICLSAALSLKGLSYFTELS